MFFFLRRFIQLIFLGLMVCGGFYIYERRHWFDPLVDLVEAWRIKEGVQQQVAGELIGTPKKVIDGESFTLNAEPKGTWYVKLTGIDAPQPAKPGVRSDPEVAESRKRLEDLLGTNQVRVVVTYMQPTHRAMGLVYVGETNVNQLLVREGKVQVDRKLLNGLKLREKYELIRAEPRVNAD